MIPFRFQCQLFYIFFFMFGIFIGVFFTKHGSRNHSTHTVASEWDFHTGTCQMRKSSLMKQLINVQKSLATGHRYARSSVTISSIFQAFSALERVVQSIYKNSAYHTVHQNQVLMEKNVYLSPKLKTVSNSSENRDLDVCPEKWMGMLYGYPYFYTGFLSTGCTWGKSISDLVTMVIDFSGTNKLTVESVLLEIYEHHPNIKIILFHTFDLLTTLPSSVIGLKKKSVGHIEMSEAVALVSTKYILFAQNIQKFTNDSQIERLVRMVDFIGVDVAAGSHRNASGHWKIDCFQWKMRNFDFRIVEGYDLSYNSCMYCDYVGGPIVAKTQLFVDHPFHASTSYAFTFLDWFYRLSKQDKTVMNCPDAMYFTNSVSIFSEISKEKWIPFAKLWKLNYISLPSHRIELSCSDLDISCQRAPKGMTNMPCCLRKLSNMLKYFLDLSTSVGVESEVEAGTIVGGVKMYGTLPWERDSDLNYLSIGGNQQKLIHLIPAFKKRGYTLVEGKKPENCDNSSKAHVNCGYFSLRANGWRIECWGTLYQAGLILTEMGQNATKILIDGSWVITYPNPALYARNHYGDDIFKHVEHWAMLGYKSGWIPYEAGSFLDCSEPGSHNCLDQYLPVGNLQFQKVWL